MNEIIFGKIRVQLLSEDIIRIEYAKCGHFCDDNTFFIPDKEKFIKNQIQYYCENNIVIIGEYKLYIPENSKTLTGLRLEKNGKTVYRYKKHINTGELPSIEKTPIVFGIYDNPRILIPNGGYSNKRKGQYKVQKNVGDIYLLLCDGDHKKLRKLYTELTGAPELVRLATLGAWNSKYYAYTEQTAKQLILDYEAHDVPLDNMVIDTDWRSCENGWGYDINTKLFPDMKKFLDFAHSHNINIMFNDHPEPVNNLDAFKAKEIAYREKNLQSLMKLGVDTWWYDRNWMTSLISPTDNVRHETIGLYLFSEITKHFYQKQSKDDRIYRRPDIMGNVVNILNGAYLGISDTASHRYGIQWTGDISTTPDILTNEVKNMLLASLNEVVYTHADCGGHNGTPSKEGFVRWMQFGTLSPVFRPHCTNTVEKTREPWAYDDETLDIVREYNNLRYRLMPVIYKNAYSAYECGEPICKPVAWNYPDDKRACKQFNEYMLGDDILLRPIGGESPKPLDKSNYVKPVSANYYNGRELAGEPIAKATYEMLNMFLDHISPEKNVPIYDFSARFETEIYFEKDIQLVITCDDGARVFIDGKKVLEDNTLHSALSFKLGKIEGGVPHKITVEYFQAGGEACCGLYYFDWKEDCNTRTYLPRGKWLDPFDGKIYIGEKAIRKNYNLRRTPMFIRLGALIPLAYEARNTKEQKWDRLVLDYYPDKDASDSGFIYEDDGESTAYKLGYFRKTPYRAFYDLDENAYIVRLEPSKGIFDGDKCYDKRTVTVKCHMLGEARNICGAALNGKTVELNVASKTENTFPLGTDCSAADSKTACITFVAECEREYEIKFYGEKE